MAAMAISHIISPPSPTSSSPVSSALSSPLSSPLSCLSRSPSPPRRSSPSPEMQSHDRYPTPSSSASTSSSCASPVKSSDACDDRPDGQPPAKRRRILPKERITRSLDLSANDDAESIALIDQLKSVLQRKKKIVVIAGAGISVSAGIPDFRSSDGLFRTLKDKHKIKGGGKQLFDASVYKDNKSTAEFHKMVRDLSKLTKAATPTPFHHMLATLAQEGRLMRLYTQNVDCIDTSMAPLATTIPLNAKGPWPVTVQLHGGLEKMQCTMCSTIEPFRPELFEGPEPPCCETCREADHVRTSFAGKRSHGIGRLRPRMVLYHEYNPDEDAIGAVAHADLRRVPDAVIVVGTSLKVPGVRRIVRELCQVTRSRRDGFTAWLNLDSEPQGVDMKGLWDLVVKGKSDDIAKLVALPQWDWDESDINRTRTWDVSGSPERQAKKAIDMEKGGRWDIVVESRRLKDCLSESSEQMEGANHHRGLLTPGASPRQQSPSPRKDLYKKAAAKQSKLNFNSHAVVKIEELDEVKSTKPAKPAKAPRAKKSAAAKTIVSKAAEKPKNSLTTVFKATKSTALSAAARAKAQKETLPLLDAQPCKPAAEASPSTIFSHLPPLRPPPPPKTADSFMYTTPDPDSSLSDLSILATSDHSEVDATSQICREISN